MNAETNMSNEKDKRKHRKAPVLIVLFVLVIGIVTVGLGLVIPAVNKTKAYNEAVKAYNMQVESYNELCKKACVDNIGGMAGEAIALETIGEGFFDVMQTVFKGNNAAKIAKDTETLQKLSEEINEDIQMIGQITDPDENWVMERLKNTEHVTDVQCVTKKHDPNQMLGKKGGYKGCVYFSVSVIDPNTITGKDIVDKGTDGGGCVEIFSTLEDAEARCAYLEGFDNTILYTGSYAIVGTMVIRTSYLLNDEQQYALTDEITTELTGME